MTAKDVAEPKTGGVTPEMTLARLTVSPFRRVVGLCISGCRESSIQT